MQAWALVRNNAPLACVEIEDRPLKGSEVRLKVTHCGVCHSDLHICRGWYDFGGGRKVMLSDRGITLPRALGHEVLGRVVELGPSASGVEIGDVRVVYPWIGCGQCKICARGDENLCDNMRTIGIKEHGGFASHVTVPDSRYLVDPGGIDHAWAATLACSGLTVYSAVNKLLPLDPEEPVLLIGCGGLGLAAVSMLRARGHRNIVATDIDDEKLKAALAAGVRSTVDSRRDDVLDALLKESDGPFAAILDFVNSPETTALALAALDKNGKLILVGVGRGELPVSLPAMVFGAKTVRGTNTGTLRELREVIELANSGKLDPVPISLMEKSSTNEAVSLLQQGKVIGRLVLV